MRIKFSEDVVPLTDLKVNPGRGIKRVTEAQRPLLLTSRGPSVAVFQSISDYELAEEERAFMRVVDARLAVVDAGRELSLAEARDNSSCHRCMATISIDLAQSALDDL